MDGIDWMASWPEVILQLTICNWFDDQAWNNTVETWVVKVRKGLLNRPKKLDLQLDSWVASGHLGPVLRQLASLGPISTKMMKLVFKKKVGELGWVCEMSVLRQHVVKAVLYYLCCQFPSDLARNLRLMATASREFEKTRPAIWAMVTGKHMTSYVRVSFFAIGSLVMCPPHGLFQGLC